MQVIMEFKTMKLFQKRINYSLIKTLYFYLMVDRNSTNNVVGLRSDHYSFVRIV